MSHGNQDQGERLKPEVSRTERTVELETRTPQGDLESDKGHSLGEASPAELQDELYDAGIPLRGLSEHEAHQFPGIKRERWW